MSYAVNDEDDRQGERRASSTTASTLNDSMLLGGNPPFQPQVAIEQRTRRTARAPSAPASLPVRHDERSIRCSSIRRLTSWSGGRAARDSARLHRRRRPTSDDCGAQPAARARHQPAAGRHRSGEPGREHRSRCDPTRATASIRLSENAGYSTLQRPAGQCGAALQERFQVQRRLHARATQETTRATSATSCSTRYDDTGFWGNSTFDRRHVFDFYYIYDLPFYQTEQASREGKRTGRLADYGVHLHANWQRRCG